MPHGAAAVTTDFNRHRLLYKGHLLSCVPARLPDGRFRARVTITAMSADVTIAQRFMDLNEHATEEAAVEQARRTGIAWVDEQAMVRASPA
jgi:hypothetical protein